MPRCLGHPDPPGVVRQRLAGRLVLLRAAQPVDGHLGQRLPCGGHGVQLEADHGHLRGLAALLDDGGDRRDRFRAALDLHEDPDARWKIGEDFLKEGDLLTGKLGSLPSADIQTAQGCRFGGVHQVVHAAGSARGVLVVDHHHPAIGREVDIQFHPLCAAGPSRPHGGKCVLRCHLGETAMRDDSRRGGAESGHAAEPKRGGGAQKQFLGFHNNLTTTQHAGASAQGKGKARRADLDCKGSGGNPPRRRVMPSPHARKGGAENAARQGRQAFRWEPAATTHAIGIPAASYGGLMAHSSTDYSHWFCWVWVAMNRGFLHRRGARDKDLLRIEKFGLFENYPC